MVVVTFNHPEPCSTSLSRPQYTGLLATVPATVSAPINYERLVDPGGYYPVRSVYSQTKLEIFYLRLVLSCREGTGRMRDHLDSAASVLEAATIAARCGSKGVRGALW